MIKKKHCKLILGVWVGGGEGGGGWVYKFYVYLKINRGKKL